LNQQTRILVLGHKGLVGSAVVRLLQLEGYSDVIYPDFRLDLRDQTATRAYFEEVRPEYVVLAAARVGGIVANSSYPYDFIYDNVMIAGNVLESCRHFQVRKTLMLGSTCIYPRMAPQPIQEEALLTGPLEPTNQWYAVAKIAGIKLAQAARAQHGMDVIAAMPTNLYGPNDNFDLNSSHVLPAMIRKFHSAKANGEPHVTLWGTGTPRREFLHVDDLARALLLMLKEYSSDQIVNVGSGQDVSISELAELVRDAVGYSGNIDYDTSKPDGTPKKQTDIKRISALGWAPRIELKSGIQQLYHWYLENHTAEAEKATAQPR
jgi:GDP-L-fucose synthase